MMFEDGKVVVVCEKILQGKCDAPRGGCAAASENQVSYTSTRSNENGQRYYSYNCSRDGKGIKLLDIHFKLKTNPNFLFKNRKRR